MFTFLIGTRVKRVGIEVGFAQTSFFRMFSKSFDALSGGSVDLDAVKRRVKIRRFLAI